MIELTERVGAEPVVKVQEQKAKKKKAEDQTLPGVAVGADGILPDEGTAEAREQLKKANIKMD